MMFPYLSYLGLCLESGKITSWILVTIYVSGLYEKVSSLN